MFRRQRTGSVICSSCGTLVGVNDERCYNCGRRNPSLWGLSPVLRGLGTDLGFMPFVVGTCVIVYVLTIVFSQGSAGPDSPVAMTSPSVPALFLFGGSGAVPVFEFGRWWTLLSANWLHGGVLHILFNMMWVRDLAPATAEQYGPGRSVIIYLVGGMFGFLASSVAGWYLPRIPFLSGAVLTVGASAAIFALMGALYYCGHRTGRRAMREQVVYWAIVAGIMGVIVPGIDNWAHLGGFAGGYLVGRILDPLKPERIDHLAIAVALLVASIASIVVSVLHGAQALR